jgi:predicted metal-dependent TIM-barrel fold hydrolase
MINSAADWGPSNPMAVPECIAEMKSRGFSPEVIKKVTYDNPLAFFRQSKRWKE